MTSRRLRYSGAGAEMIRVLVDGSACTVAPPAVKATDCMASTSEPPNERPLAPKPEFAFRLVFIGEAESTPALEDAIAVGAPPAVADKPPEDKPSDELLPPPPCAPWPLSAPRRTSASRVAWALRR